MFGKRVMYCTEIGPDDYVAVMDYRDLFCGSYAVERGGMYRGMHVVYISSDYEKCVEKMKQIKKERSR